MKVKIYLYSILLFLVYTFSAFSYYEDDDLPDGYVLATPEQVAAFIEEEPDFDLQTAYRKSVLKHSKHVPDSNHAMETLESGPSAIVAGCVNAITGAFFESHTPIIGSGALPINVQCSYCSSEKEWNFQHMPSLETGKSAGQNHLYARYVDDGGSGMTYRTYTDDTYPAGVKNHELNIPSALFEKGLTNCGSGLISGKTNWRNSRLSMVLNQDTRSYMLRQGSHVNRIFSRYKSGKDKRSLSGKFRLESENHPNGNRLRYSYNKKGDLFSVKGVNKKNLPLSSLHITRASDWNKIDWKTNSGTVKFHFKDHSEKQLARIYPSHGIPITYDYNKNDLLEKKNLPEGRFLKIEYHDMGESKGQVRSLSTPIAYTHFFSYLPGITYVIGDNCFTTYCYDKKTKRLESITKHGINGTCLSKDHFTWHSGEKKGGNLFSRSFSDGQKGYFTRMLSYDDFGNVNKDHLFGNLTGKFQDTLTPENIASNHIEVYEKTYRHSQDRRNLLLEENDQKKILCCDYYHPSLLLKHRLTKSGSTILKREFFEYDDNGVLVKEIVDDGQSEQKDDLACVTERHIKVITPRTQYPVGLPKTLKEYYLDLSTHQEVLLKKVEYDHNSQGKVLREDHYDGNGSFAYSLKWDYDVLGNIKEKTDALGQITTFEYDANGNKKLEKGPLTGWYKKFTYDLGNRLIEEKEHWPDETVLITTHTYNHADQKKSTTNPYGQTTTFDYDGLGRISKTTGPLLFTGPLESIIPEEKTEYDAMGNAIVRIDANGSITKASYTIRGKPYRIEYPDGSVEQKEYSLAGLLIKEIAKNGLTTTYTYDPFDRITETVITDPQGTILKTKSAIYSTFQLLSETDEEGKTTVYEYDGAGRRISMRNRDHFIRYEYDPLGRVTKTIDFIDDTNLRITCKEYDFLDRIIEERNEDQNGEVFKKEKYTYDVNGNKTSTSHFTQAGTATTQTEYYPNNKPFRITDALGNQTLCFYNHEAIHKGQTVLQITKVDPLGNQEVTTHDTHGNVCKQEKLDPFGQPIQCEESFYDALGQKVLSQVTVYQGQEQKKLIETTWEYDAMGNVRRTVEAVGTPEQKSVRHHYNNFGQKERTDMPNGISIINEYDLFGRLSTYKSTDNTIHYQYTYDQKDRPLLIKDLVHNTTNERIYDDNGSLKSETIDNGLILAYTYDQLDRPTNVILPDQSFIRYRYNASHLIAVDRVKDNEIVYTHTYDQYDLSGNLIEETLLGKAGKIHYDYDLLGRPVSVKAPHWQETIPQNGFDTAGNLLERKVIDDEGTISYTYAYDHLYQLISESGCVSHTYKNDSVYNRTAKDENPYSHNSLNQLLSQSNCSYEYDRNGNLLEKKSGSETTRYVYDALDRLIEVHNGPNTTSYTYDSFHRRLSKTQNDSTTYYFYQNQNEIGAFCQDKIIQLRVLGITYGAEIGGAVALELDGKTYSPIHDPQGNVVALLDSSGKLVEGYRYSAFGEIQFLSESTVDNPWRFSSKRFDAETGFIYFGRRYYDPEIGRWTTPDPVGYADGPNLYAYVHNHPLAYIDPDGQFAFLLVPLLISLATDVAIDFALPLAATYAEPYLGVTATTFLAGVVKGMNSDFSAGTPLEAGGMGIGALITWKKNAVKGLLKQGTALAVETTEIVASALTKNVTRTAVHQGTNQVAHQTNKIAEQFLLKGNSQTTQQIWSATKRKTSVENAFSHWKDHRKEFPEIFNAKQYVEASKKFIKQPPPGTLIKTRANGEIILYHEKNNLFAAYTKEGIPKTMFKPNTKVHEYPSNLEYFYGQ